MSETTAGDNPAMSDEDIMKHAIAAAINAWPGFHIGAKATIAPYIILPLSQGPSDE